jgi:hypothetical protein
MGSRALSAITRLNSALTKVSPQDDRLAYMRVYTTTGGDPLIGRPTTATIVDTLFTPQPMYTRLARYFVGPTAKAEEILDTTGKARIGDEYMFTVSATAMTFVQLQQEGMRIVLKDSSGGVEEFEITDYERIAFQGTDIMFALYVRSLVRP